MMAESRNRLVGYARYGSTHQTENPLLVQVTPWVSIRLSERILASIVCCFGIQMYLKLLGAPVITTNFLLSLCPLALQVVQVLSLI